MKIVLAFDSFKGSLRAAEACDITAKALRGAMPDAEVVSRPIGDGGEGTIDALLNALDGEWRTAEVMGPLPATTVEARYGWCPDQRLALVELAVASGLTLLPEDRRNPMRTTTYGTGELINLALDLAPERILIGAGGSATVDGGVGAATALGWRFLDADGQPIGLGAERLANLVTIKPPGRPLPRVEILCDVTNPLLGPRGAAAVFGPQKGATPDQVPALEDGLARVADLVERTLGRTITEVPGAGAAGGFAGGGMAWFGAKLVPGIETVLETVGFRDVCRDADWVVTGEGSFDDQSLDGKAVSGVLVAARAANPGIHTAVLAGRVSFSDPARSVADVVVPISPEDLPAREAMQQAPAFLEAAAAAWAATLTRA